MQQENTQFSEGLRRKLDEKGIKPSELSRRTGISKQNISRIMNQVPHPVTNTPARASEEVVLKIAKALDWDTDEALMLAGYAPLDMPSNFERKVAALFRGSEAWTEGKRKQVFKHVEGLINLIESEEE